MKLKATMTAVTADISAVKKTPTKSLITTYLEWLQKNGECSRPPPTKCRGCSE